MSKIYIKSIDTKHATIAGWGVVFGDVDLTGDTFTKDTDFQLDLVPVKPVFYDHTMDGSVKNVRLGSVINTELKTDGIWIEAQLERNKEYVEEVLSLVKAGVLGWSSGSVGHLVRRDEKFIKSWPVVEFSLTPTPAEPRTLGVEQIKALAVSSPDLSNLLPEDMENISVAYEIHDRSDIENKQITTITEVIQMDDTKEAVTDQVTQEEKQESVSMDDLKSIIDNAINERIEAMKAEKPIDKPAMPLFQVKKVTSAGLSDDPIKSFVHYIRTGDKGAVKSAYKGAWQEGNDAEGGVLVPEDLNLQITAKLGEYSVPRQAIAYAGGSIFTTNRDVYVFPVEDTAMTKATLLAEEAAISGAENESTFAKASAQIYKFAKLIKVSEELEMDEIGALQNYLANAFARVRALTENYYTLVGSGVSEPQGVLVGGTAALTLDSASAIGYAEVPELMYKIGSAYADRANWTMRWATWGYLQGLAISNNWAFQPSPAGTPSFSGSPVLEGHPVFVSDQHEALATGKKSMCFGNWAYYGMAERQGMVVQRLNELYAGNGQIGLLCKFRFGGTVLQAEAFQYATHP